MVHGGVGTDRKPQNASAADSRSGAEFGQNGIQCFLQDGILKLLFSTGTTLLDDPVDHIGTVADLAVTGGTFCQDFAGFQIGQNHGDGGGADVNGTASQCRVIGGADIHAGKHAVFQNTLHAHTEAVLPQDMGQADHHRERNTDFRRFHPGLDGPLQPLIVRHGVFQGRIFHPDVQSPEIIVKADTAFPQFLLAILKNGNFFGTAEVRGLHSVPVGAGNIRHEHGAVGTDLAVAAQAPAGFIFFVGDVTAPDGFQLTFNEPDSAFAAGTVAGAGSVDGHIGSSCSLQQIITGVTFHCNRASALDLEGYLHIGSSFRKK